MAASVWCNSLHERQYYAFHAVFNELSDRAQSRGPMFASSDTDVAAVVALNFPYHIVH